MTIEEIKEKIEKIESLLKNPEFLTKENYYSLIDEKNRLILKLYELDFLKEN